MNDHILDLAEKAANYKRGGNHLLKAISEIEQYLVDLFDSYSQFQFIDEPVAFLNNLVNSNIGPYGPALVYVDAHDSKVDRARFKPMPPTWGDAGRGFYLHSDFRIWIDYATRSDITYVATSLALFLKSLADFLESKGSENSMSATHILTMTRKLKAAVK